MWWTVRLLAIIQCWHNIQVFCIFMTWNIDVFECSCAADWLQGEVTKNEKLSPFCRVLSVFFYVVVVVACVFLMLEICRSLLFHSPGVVNISIFVLHLQQHLLACVVFFTTSCISFHYAALFKTSAIPQLSLLSLTALFSIRSWCWMPEKCTW